MLHAKSHQNLFCSFSVFVLYNSLSCWFFSWCNIYHYRNVTPDQKYGQHFVFSLRLALLMEIVGFSVRFLSTFLWIQIYRLGVSTVDNTIYHADYSVRNSFVNPSTHDVARQNSNSDEILGGAIYDPTYYSSLFEDAQDKRCMPEVRSTIIHKVAAKVNASACSSIIYSLQL